MSEVRNVVQTRGGLVDPLHFERRKICKFLGHFSPTSALSSLIGQFGIAQDVANLKQRPETTYISEYLLCKIVDLGAVAAGNDALCARPRPKLETLRTYSGTDLGRIKAYRI